jgi:hypothetical protein
MTSHTQKPTHQAPAKITGYKSMFNLIKHTPQGKRVICHDLTFDQATGLLAEIPGTLALKFSRTGALS